MCFTLACIVFVERRKLLTLTIMHSSSFLMRYAQPHSHGICSPLPKEQNARIYWNGNRVKNPRSYTAFSKDFVNN